MFELKTEEMGGKGCIMWSNIIYTACQVLGLSQNSGKLGEEWVRMGLKVTLNRFLIGRREGKSPF
jgi:hypothetical protein